MQGRTATWKRLPSVMAFVVVLHGLFLWALIADLRALPEPPEVIPYMDPIQFVVPQPAVPLQPKPVVKPRSTQAPAPEATLKLHVAPPVNIVAAPLPPSGLSPVAKALGPPAAAGNGTGLVVKGRSALAQSLQFHADCASDQAEGKPIPVDCHLTALGHEKTLGPNPNDKDDAAAVVAIDKLNRYKSQAGNTDYWQRVNASPGPHYTPPDGPPPPGTYSDAKTARVMGGTDTDPKDDIQPH